MGESLSNLSVKELKQLENRLERGITRIRSKKVKYQSNNQHQQMQNEDRVVSFFESKGVEFGMRTNYHVLSFTSHQHEQLFAEIDYMQKRVIFWIYYLLAMCLSLFSICNYWFFNLIHLFFDVISRKQIFKMTICTSELR